MVDRYDTRQTGLIFPQAPASVTPDKLPKGAQKKRTDVLYAGTYYDTVLHQYEAPSVNGRDMDRFTVREEILNPGGLAAEANIAKMSQSNAALAAQADELADKNKKLGAETSVLQSDMNLKLRGRIRSVGGRIRGRAQRGLAAAARF